MGRHDVIVSELASLIGEQRDQIVRNVRSAVALHIGSKSPQECLGLVLRDSRDAVVGRLPLAAEMRYAKALIAFVRKQSFEGRTLDSDLTDSTAQVVADAFSDGIGQNADEITRRLVPLIISDTRFAAALSAALLSAYSGPVPAIVQRKVLSILTAKLTAVLSQTLDSSTTTALKASLAKLAVATVASPIAVKITAAICVSLMATLKPILVKLLASTAFKAAVVAKLKTIIIGSLLGAFVKIIGVKLGLTAGSAFMVVLIPAVLVWIGYEVVHFPAKLATKVSEGVADDLSGNFAETNLTLADTLVEKIVVEGAATLARQLINDEVIAEFIRASVSEAA